MEEDESNKNYKADEHVSYFSDLKCLGSDYSDDESEPDSDGNDADDNHSMCAIPELVCHDHDSSSESHSEENDVGTNHLMRAALPNVGCTTIAKDDQQPDENNKEKSSSAQCHKSIHEEDFYQKVNDKVDELTFRRTVVSREKHAKIMIALQMSIVAASGGNYTPCDVSNNAC